MGKDTIQRMVRAIIFTLNENKDRWTIHKLAEKLSEQDLYPGSLKLGTTLQSLIACGRVNGTVPTDGKIIVWHKERDEDSMSMEDVKASEAHLRNEISSEKRKVSDLMEANKKWILQVQEADRRAAEAKGKERIVSVEFKNGTKTTRLDNELFHVKFERVSQLAAAGKNIMLYGPTGSGKSYIAAQLAKAMGRYFGFVSCTAGMSEGVLGGRLLPLGNNGSFEYIMSEYVKCFEKGGVFFLDEIDAADSNVLMMINAGLANGILSLPNRSKKPYAERHKDFVCIAAANTLGTNGDRMYTGRNKLDTSTLNRFQIGQVFIDYDHEVENQLCPDKPLLTRCWKIREAINEHRLERAMSTRFVIDAYAMRKDYEWTDEQIFGKQDGFFSGWREDEINKVNTYCRN